MRLPSIETNNRNFTRGLAVLPAAAGSVISVMLIAASVWAIVSIAIGRYRVRYARTDRYVVVPGVFYTLVMGASIVAHANSLNDLGFVVTPLIYLLPAVLLPRYRVFPGDYFDVFLRAAPWCGILALPIVAWQEMHGVGRPAAGAGNPFPFAMICASLGPVALLNLRDRAGARAILAVAGFLACAAGIILAETRTAWLAFAINVLVLGWFFSAGGLGRNRRLVIGAVVIFAAMLVVASGPVLHRAEGLVHDVTTAAHGGAPSESLSARLGMWGAAIAAIRERPLSGYGAENRRQIIHEISVRVGASANGSGGVETLDYSHFHNGLLTATVDAGILGTLATALLLFSPLILAFKSPRDALWRKRMAFASFFFWTYAITGSFNIMFGQDLIDALFITGLLMLALSVREPVVESALAAGTAA